MVGLVSRLRVLAVEGEEDGDRAVMEGLRPNSRLVPFIEAVIGLSHCL